MDGTVVAFFVPTVLFLCIVAPTWIFMHYRSKQKSQGSLSEQEIMELETLANHAERMGDRIETLEAILDSETPEWRNRLREGEG
jgi:phage shock protein B